MQRQDKPIKIFIGKKRPLNRVNEVLVEKLQKIGLENMNDTFLRLENPPHFEDCMAEIERYVGKIREMQLKVRDSVSAIDLCLTETEGKDDGTLFETDFYAVHGEFGNWGISTYYNAMCTNTGHWWVTVESARFKSQLVMRGEARGMLEELKKYKEELKVLVEPISLFGSTLFGYEKLWQTMMEEFARGDLYGMVYEEYKRIKETKHEYETKTNFIQKGILSLSFVTSLLCKLEESLDTSKHSSD